MKNSEYSILYKKSAIKDFKKLDATQRKKIVKKIETKLSNEPHKGKQLKGEFQGFWCIRIGNYRSVYRIMPKEVVVIAIGHRKEIYKPR